MPVDPHYPKTIPRTSQDLPKSTLDMLVLELDRQHGLLIDPSGTLDDELDSFPNRVEEILDMLNNWLDVND